MRTSTLALVPLVLIGGLAIGAYKLSFFQKREMPQCLLGTCPLGLQESDSGKTLTYAVGTRFTAYFDETKNPQANLRCTPGGILGTLPAPMLEPPLYAVILEALAAGNCTLTNDNFSATIVIQ